MILFADNFFKLRDTFILPLVHTKVSFNKFKYWDLKNILTRKLVSVERIAGDRFKLTINKNDFLMSMFVEMENFYTRTIIQFVDLKLSFNISSKNWLFITNYYLIFFSITTLFRILQRGFVYIDNKKVKLLSDLITILGGETLLIKPGNYFFCKQNEESDLLTIDFSLKTQGVHEHSWNYLHELLLGFSASSKADEKVIIERLKDIIRVFNPTFVSSLRNEINYQGPIGFSEIKNELVFFLCDDLEKYTKKLLTISLNDTLIDRMLIANLYGHYFFLLVLKLYSEFSIRSSQNVIEPLRNQYLKRNKIILPDLD